MNSTLRERILLQKKAEIVELTLNNLWEQKEAEFATEIVVSGKRI